MGLDSIEDAYAETKSKGCTVNISSIGNLPAITYNDSKRVNLDGTFYPGDAFHFMFQYKGLKNCLSVVVTPLEVTGNIVIKSALVVSNSDPDPMPHNIIKYEWVPTLVQTSYYYTIIDSRLSDGCKGGCQRWTIYTLSEEPIAVISGYGKTEKVIEGNPHRVFENWWDDDRTIRSGVIKVTADKWRLIKAETRYNIGLDRHILEDQGSLDRFVDFAKNRCSNLKQHSGCVFGHIEIGTDAQGSQEICLWNELQERYGIYHNIAEQHLPPKELSYKDKYGRYDTKYNYHEPHGAFYKNRGGGSNIYYDDSLDTWYTDHNISVIGARHVIKKINGKSPNECVSVDEDDEVKINVEGTRRHCNGGKCIPFTHKDSASIYPTILTSFGDINFQYPTLYDPDGFPAKNLDSTYYRDDAVGIFGVPDVLWKKDREGILAFIGNITSNLLIQMDLQSYNYTYKTTITGEKMSPYTFTTENGDMLSSHYTPDLLGNLTIPHNSKLYNIYRYIGEYTGDAHALIVVYDPQITDTYTWTRLADAGTQSIDNRYAIAIEYAGSHGGGPDDGDDTTIHKNRPVKITDLFSAVFVQNHLGRILGDWNPSGDISTGQGLDDLMVLPSVYDYIPQNYTFQDSFTNVTDVYFNSTVQDVMIESAGYARVLIVPNIDPEITNNNILNLISYDTFTSQDYGGVPIDYLTNTQYVV